MKYAIVGGGLAGCIMAHLLPNSVIYERNKIGGLCQDNKNYQDFIHVFHTDRDDVWKFISDHTVITPHRTTFGSYYDSEINQHPPKELNSKVLKKAYEGYSDKMWHAPIPPEAVKRIVPSEDGYFFHTKYEGIPDFRLLFSNLTKDVKIIEQNVRDGDLDGPVILTGPIDEYFNYCYGELPYRGMKSVHYQSEIRLPKDAINFSDPRIPFQRMIDYDKLGYEGGYIGIEIACNEKHYPVRTPSSEETYKKYEKLAKEKGVILCGRTANYHYMNMDEIVEKCFDLLENWYMR